VFLWWSSVTGSVWVLAHLLLLGSVRFLAKPGFILARFGFFPVFN